jgi:hypothetical protein
MHVKHHFFHSQLHIVVHLFGTTKNMKFHRVQIPTSVCGSQFVLGLFTLVLTQAGVVGWFVDRTAQQNNYSSWSCRCIDMFCLWFRSSMLEFPLVHSGQVMNPCCHTFWEARGVNVDLVNIRRSSFSTCNFEKSHEFSVEVGFETLQTCIFGKQMNLCRAFPTHFLWTFNCEGEVL